MKMSIGHSVPRHSANANTPGSRCHALIAWIWVAPAVFFVALFLFYPMLYTIWLSFLDANSVAFVGFKNYVHIFTTRSMLEVLQNNLLWLVVATLATVLLGLLIAALVDRVRFESAAKAMIFIPMAISFVGAGVIWQLVYKYAPADQPQTGIVNALFVALGGKPQSWITTPGISNLALIVIYVWMWTGFCMIIFSAAIKGVPADLLEAARCDGANGLTVFFRITVPAISPTIAVVITTMVINVLKIFDVIYVMTGGNYHTDVIALEYYQQYFNFNDFGVASALTVVLLLAIVPLMAVNIRRFRQQETQR